MWSIFKEMKSLSIFMILLNMGMLTKQHKLTEVTEDLGSISVLQYEPSPMDFYEKYIHTSTPVLIRPKNKLWQTGISQITPDVLLENLQHINGKAYQRPIWTTGWPVEVRVSFEEFMEKSKDENLYWDSPLPINSTLMKHFPLPFALHCDEILNKLVSTNLLYTNSKASSVFHQDGSENIFLQLSGTKTWLLANYTFSEHAYADSYTLQAGLSPVNPEEVDLTKYPLVSDIGFYSITTHPGDLLYVPQYWWHYVTSAGTPNIGFNYWLDVFDANGIENSFRIVEYVKKFAEIREAAPDHIDCPNLQVSMAPNMEMERNTDPPFDTVYNIYFGSDDGAFYAIDSKGSLLWKHQTGSDAGSTPVLNNDEGAVFFAGEDGNLYAFDALKGVILWKASLGDGVAAAVRNSVQTSTVIVASLDMHVYAFAENGTRLWKAGTFGGELWASPHMSKNSVIVCVMAESHMSNTAEISSNTVLKLDSANGKVIWGYSSGAPVFASPAVPRSGEIVVISSYDNHIHVIDFTTGVLIWKLDIGGYCNASPVISKDGKWVFLTTTNGVVMCIAMKSRSVQWQTHYQGNDVLSSPLLTDMHLFQAINHSLFALNRFDGSIMWKFTGKNSFISSPRMDMYGTLYIGCNDNLFYAINATTGIENWHFSTKGAVVGTAMFSPKLIEKSSCGALL